MSYQQGEEYHPRPDERTVNREVTSAPMYIAATLSEAKDTQPDMENMVERGPKLKNSDVLKDLQNQKLSHLPQKNKMR